MSKEEQIKQYENELFILEMKDRWSNEDYNKVKDLRSQIKELKDD